MSFVPIRFETANGDRGSARLGSFYQMRPPLGLLAG
jgi:hypothetical protein